MSPIKEIGRQENNRNLKPRGELKPGTYFPRGSLLAPDIILEIPLEDNGNVTVVICDYRIENKSSKQMIEVPLSLKDEKIHTISHTPTGTRLSLVWEPGEKEKEERLEMAIEKKIEAAKTLRYIPLGSRLWQFFGLVDTKLTSKFKRKEIIPPVLAAFICSVPAMLEAVIFVPSLGFYDFLTGRWNKERAKIRQELISTK